LDAGAEETGKALYDSFTEWCHANGEPPIAQRSFGQRLQQLGSHERRTGKARKRRGIRLKTDIEVMSLEVEASPARAMASSNVQVGGSAKGILVDPNDPEVRELLPELVEL